MSHTDGYPTPASWLTEGTVLVYRNADGDWEQWTVPATLRMDRAGHVAAQKHMREPAMPGRAMRWES